MITNDQELQATEERISLFYRTLVNMRLKARSTEEYRLYSGSYLAEIEQMHDDIMEYLKGHPSEPVPAEAA